MYIAKELIFQTLPYVRIANYVKLSYISNEMKTKKTHNEDLDDKIKKLESENSKLRSQLRDIASQNTFDSPYLALAEKSKDGILILQDNKIKYINTGFLEMLGYEKNEVLEESYEKFVPEEEWIKLQDNTRRRLLGENVSSIYETKLYSRSGNVINIEINVTVTFYENKPAVIAAIRDITEIKEIHHQLERKTFFLESMLSKLPLILFSIDKKGVITLLEGDSLKILGLKPGDVVGTSFRNMGLDGS